MINGVMVDTSKVQTSHTSQTAPMAIITTPDELVEMSNEFGQTFTIHPDNKYHKELYVGIS